MSTAQPTIIVAGATGNTGRGVVSTLSSLLSSTTTTSSASTPDSTWRILALTRTSTSPSALALAGLPHVEVVEKDWTTITTAWLQSVNARRAFLAPHIGVGQFHDEALFHSALRRAGVSYVVRISTSAGNVGPESGVSHGLNHWAAEELLSALPGLGWTSLRPNLFIGMVAAGLVQWLKDYKAGKEEPLKVVIDETAGVAAVDPLEVGAVAATLLALSEQQVQEHSGKKYTVNGPRDVRGDELVKLVEKYAHTTVQNTVFRDTSWIDYVTPGAPPSLKESLLAAPRILWDGSCSNAQNPTSPAVLKLRAPANDALSQIDAALAEVK